MCILPDLQSEFASALFDRRRLPPSDVTSHTALLPTRRFNIYRNNVFSSLIDVLEAYFPVVLRLVGQDFFRAMAREFVRAHPPRSPIISRYGIGFPKFIEAFPPTADTPYLADVARLELMRQRAYHAADAPSLAADDLTQLSLDGGGDVVFGFHPAAGVFMSQFPVISIWSTNTFDDAVRPIDLSAGGEQALVTRRRLDVLVTPIPAASATFVLELMEGRPLRDAVGACDHRLDLAGSLAMLIDAGALCEAQRVQLQLAGYQDD